MEEVKHTGHHIARLNDRNMAIVQTDYYHWLCENHTGHNLHDRVLYLAARIKSAKAFGLKRGWPDSYTMDTLSMINDHFYFLYLNGVLQEPENPKENTDDQAS